MYLTCSPLSALTSERIARKRITLARSALGRSVPAMYVPKDFFPARYAPKDSVPAMYAPKDSVPVMYAPERSFPAMYALQRPVQGPEKDSMLLPAVRFGYEWSYPNRRLHLLCAAFGLYQ